MAIVFAAEVEPDLNTSAKEGPVHFGAKPRVGQTSFTVFFSDEDEEPSPQPSETEKNSTIFLSSSENLSHPHPSWPSGIKIDPSDRPTRTLFPLSNSQLYSHLSELLEPSLNDLTKSCSAGIPNNPSNLDASHSELCELKMTTLRKFLLFSSTLNVDAPPKTEKVKDFDSTMKLLSICDTPETKPTPPTNYIAEQRTTQRSRRIEWSRRYSNMNKKLKSYFL